MAELTALGDKWPGCLQREGKEGENRVRSYLGSYLLSFSLSEGKEERGEHGEKLFRLLSSLPLPLPLPLSLRGRKGRTW